MGMLKSCLDTGISTIHETVTFEQISQEDKEDKPDPPNKLESKTDLTTKPKSKHRVHTRTAVPVLYSNQRERNGQNGLQNTA